MDERREIFRVYIKLCKHGSSPISVRNSQRIDYKQLYQHECNWKNEKCVNEKLRFH